MAEVHGVAGAGAQIGLQPQPPQPQPQQQSEQKPTAEAPCPPNGQGRLCPSLPNTHTPNLLPPLPSLLPPCTQKIQLK